MIRVKQCWLFQDSAVSFKIHSLASSEACRRGRPAKHVRPSELCESFYRKHSVDTRCAHLWKPVAGNECIHTVNWPRVVSAEYLLRRLPQLLRLGTVGCDGIPAAMAVSGYLRIYGSFRRHIRPTQDTFSAWGQLSYEDQVCVGALYLEYEREFS